MQTGLTAAQEVQLKAFVEANAGNVTLEDVAMFAREFMTPADIVQGFVEYFTPAKAAKPSKAAKAAKQTGAAEAAPAASGPAGAEQGGSEDDSEEEDEVALEEEVNPMAEAEMEVAKYLQSFKIFN